MSNSGSPTYLVRRASTAPGLKASWEDPAWSKAQIATVNNFRPEGSAHRPETRARLLYDARNIYGIFHVRDRFVRSVRTEYFDEVWKDSCVEFFIRPRPEGGYFNLEMNAGGAHLCCFIEDPARVPGGFKKFARLPPALGQTIQIRSSLAKVVDPEVSEALDWEIRFSVPFATLEHYAGRFGGVGGRTWRGNFFKCAEEVSHPHWASWSAVDEFNFHLPRCFGRIEFE